ncbi:hypothetical protein FHS29_000388 [Saccharothrix tamanrassetensis]|uniref:YbaB/EbfC DNA-binding family protein n=1 Tax=Saccharothrix tamanrassetensis TaxID=1051531 RepID=A0A841CCB9_9PSEU|nr:YbaB/EbfC family nucleoid-associated protein [Saccharothrix tamanrassetensis]MBB5953818.1 hypothetical protein [Saccharothrix tamanrassetensis]
MDRGPSPEQRLEEYRRSLGEDSDDLGELPEDDGRFVGRSADGLVEVTVAAGRVASVAVRLSPAEIPTSDLGDHLATAVDAALASARGVVPAATDPLPDLDVLLDRLNSVGEQSSRFMRQVGSALDDVIAKVGPRTGMHGDPSPSGVDALFSDAATALRTARDSLAGFQGPQVTGNGSDEDHEVWVTIGVDGAVSKVELSGAVRDMTSRQFNDRARQAVNAALEDWTAKRRDQSPPDAAGADFGRLAAQADALRTQSLDQLRGYTTKLKSIMGSIGEP